MSLHPGSFQFLKKKPETPYKLVEPPAVRPEPFDKLWANGISLTKQYWVRPYLNTLNVSLDLYCAYGYSHHH